MGTKFAQVYATTKRKHNIALLKPNMTLIVITISKNTGKDFWTIASFLELRLKKN